MNYDREIPLEVDGPGAGEPDLGHAYERALQRGQKQDGGRSMVTYHRVRLACNASRAVRSQRAVCGRLRDKGVYDDLRQLWRLARAEDYCYEDLAAYHAPSECYADVAHGLEQAAADTVNASALPDAGALDMVAADLAGERFTASIMGLAYAAHDRGLC